MLDKSNQLPDGSSWRGVLYFLDGLSEALTKLEPIIYRIIAIIGALIVAFWVVRHSFLR